MILKKIFLILASILILFSFSCVSVVAEDLVTQDISKPDFKINVGTITPTGTQSSAADGGIIGENAAETVNNTLEVLITKLITAFGVLSLLVMTVGAGFMIIYHGQDELLTRGKSIFSYGLISLVVALSAGFLVNFVSYLLYK